MLKHEQFEELCAVAAMGELSAEEREQLSAHLMVCAPCRAACDDFSAILYQLPAAEEQLSKHNLPNVGKDPGYRERFLARAREAGVRLSPEVHSSPAHRVGFWSFPHPQFSWRAAAVASLAVALCSIAYQVRANLMANDVQTSQVPQPMKTPSNSNKGLPSNGGSPAAHDLAIDKKIIALDQENASLRQRWQQAEAQFRSATDEIARLQKEVAEQNEINVRLRQQADDHQLRLTSVQEELEKLHADQASAEVVLAARKNEIDSLSEELRSSNAALKREEDLLANGRDIRELMGARNLHIIDLFDADSQGVNQKTFGRVFYTEGKSLIFYAFDLDEKKLSNASFTYQAWGQRDGRKESVKNLGVLYVDDHAQKRWVLKVTDPNQLAEIDSVFVTLERTGSGKEPHGQKLLYAYLRSNPNHP